MDFNKAKLLYKELGKNKRLSEKRHPMLMKNTAMKIFTWCMIIFWAAYLIVFGIVFGNALKDGGREAFDELNQFFLVFLILDFLVRFGVQETPAQEVKQYRLLPIPTNFLINLFIIRRGLSWGNLFWMFFFVPFAVFSILMVPYMHFGHFIGYLFGVWLMFVLNSYWYLFWRSFVNQNMFYLLAPLAIYAVLIVFGFVFPEWIAKDRFTNSSMNFMRGFIFWNWWSFLITVAAIVVMFFLNRYFQKKFINKEIAKVEEIKKVKSREMSFLNRFGVIGEYMKLEIKSVQRNLVVRKQFLTGVWCTLVFCAITAFTDVYDQGFMKTFVCVYCFACLGVITLTSIMCAEGNYIDGLMSRKESVYSLLKAKYYFNCIICIIPMLFMIMPMISGKFTVLETFGCLFFTTGCIFPFLFQLAVYNNITIHLNAKLTKSGQSSKAQMIFSLLALFVPMGIMYTLITLFNPNIAGLIMMVMGLIGTSLNGLWIKNIYKRFMNRRYENMSGFRQTK